MQMRIPMVLETCPAFHFLPVGLASCRARFIAPSLSAFSDNLVFFVSPSDLVHTTPNERQMRLEGLVEQGSVEKSSSSVSIGTGTGHLIGMQKELRINLGAGSQRFTLTR